MHSLIHRSIVILTILTLGSCNVVSVSTPGATRGTDTPRSIETVQLLSSTLSMTNMPGTSTPDATLPLATSSPIYSPINLRCENYMELQRVPEQKELGAYQLVLDEQGSIFILDQINKLIFKLSNKENVQNVQLASEWTNCLWKDFSVRGNRLYLLVAECHPRTQQFVRGLLVRSLDNDRGEIISLDGYKTLANKIIADGNDGAYVTDQYHITVHIDSNFQVTPVTVRKVSNNSDYEIALGWDRNLYTYSYDYGNQADDELRNWGSNRTAWLASTPQLEARNIFSEYTAELEVYKDLLGIDTTGRVYFHLFGEYKPGTMPQPKGHFVRFSPKHNHLEIGQLPNDLALSSFSFSIAPSGSLYGITYDRHNASVVPRILKCEFPSD